MKRTHKNAFNDTKEQETKIDIFKLVESNRIDEAKEKIKALPQLAYDLNEGENIAHFAIKTEKLEFFKWLIDNHNNLMHSKTSTSMTPMHFAAERGHLKIIKYLQELGQPLNAQAYRGKTAIHFAAERGHLEVIEYLWEHGQPLDAQDDDEKTPMHFAAERGQLEVIKYLQEHGQPLDAGDDDGMTPMFYAAQDGHLEVIKYLREQGQALGAREWGSMAPMHFAAQYGHLEVIKYLREQGQALDSQDNDGMTPMHFAAQGGHLEVIKYLREQGQALDSQDNDGITPMFYAVQDGRLEVIKYLQEHGQPLDAQDDRGEAAMFYAARYGHLEVIKYLREQGQALDVQTDYGRKLMDFAAENGRLEVMKYLQEQGQALDVQTDRGKTAMHFAAERGQLEVVKFIAMSNFKHIDVNSFTDVGKPIITTWYDLAQSVHHISKGRILSKTLKDNLNKAVKENSQYAIDCFKFGLTETAAQFSSFKLFEKKLENNFLKTENSNETDLTLPINETIGEFIKIIQRSEKIYTAKVEEIEAALRPYCVSYPIDHLIPFSALGTMSFNTMTNNNIIREERSGLIKFYEEHKEFAEAGKLLDYCIKTIDKPGISILSTALFADQDIKQLFDALCDKNFVKPASFAIKNFVDNKQQKEDIALTKLALQQNQEEIAVLNDKLKEQQDTISKQGTLLSKFVAIFNHKFPGTFDEYIHNTSSNLDGVIADETSKELAGDDGFVTIV